MSQFIYGEEALAAAMGLAVKHFQKARLRELRQGVDWDLNQLRVAYAKNAVPRLLDLVTGRAVPPPDCLAVMEKALLATQKNGAPETEGTVKRFFMNPHLMAVELPSKAVVNIRVKTVENFRIGMSVPVRELEGGRYELAKKLPRYPGRW